MNNINFLQVMPGGHCFICHKDFEEKREEHPCFEMSIGVMQGRVSACKPGCSKRYGNLKVK